MYDSDAYYGHPEEDCDREHSQTALLVSELEYQSRGHVRGVPETHELCGVDPSDRRASDTSSPGKKAKPPVSSNDYKVVRVS
jgi:hypothetical protein